MDTAGVSNFLIALARSSVEAGILVVLVLIAQWVFQKQLTARWRCALWLVVVARLLLPFSFSSVTSIFNLLPHWTPSATPASAATPVLAAGASINPTTSFATTVTSSEPMPSIPTIGGHLWSWPVVIFAVWLAGVILLAGHVLVSSFGLWRRCTKLRPLAQPVALAVLHECCALLKIRTGPALLESVEVSSPALHGLFRPRLLLPKGFTTKFSTVELRFVFLHELGHLKRQDLWVNWVVTAVQILHWFNPLVWFAFSRWRADRELACDAMALEAAGQAQNRDYGRTILRLLENFTHPMNTPGLVGILEDKRHLRRRIGLIANYVPSRGWPRLALVLLGGLAVIGLTDAQTRSRSATDSPTVAAATASNLSSGGSPSVGQVQTAPNSNPAQRKDYAMNKSKITGPVVQAAAVGLLALATPTTSVPLHAADTPAPAVATSQLANKLIGAWILVGTPDHVGKAPTAGGRIKFFTGSHWCITQADPKSGVVIFHHGGTYRLKGNEYYETVKYADSSTVELIGRPTGKFFIQIKGDLLTDVGINRHWREVWKRLKPSAAAEASPLAKGLTGMWVIVNKPDTAGLAASKTFKFCEDGRWCDTQADPKNGVVVIHHGGTYTLKGDTYCETVDYANPDTMNLIGHTFKYDIKLKGDTLTLAGMGNPWNGVWKRAN